MSYRRRVTLGDEDRDALLAATGPVREAEAHWRALMARLRFDEVNDNTHRAMPAIFVNLMQARDIPERDRLRGAFKHAWSRNTHLLHGSLPPLTALADRRVDFRVIKGAAVQAVSGRIGVRVMGDVDLLVSADAVDVVTDVFASCGFRQGATQECSGHSSEGHFSALDFNRDDVHIDVHVAEVKEPSRLLRSMLEEPAVMITTPAGSLPTPRPEMLILHAAFHGALSSGQTDLMQAALDLATLRPLADPALLHSIASRTRTLGALLSLDSELSAWGIGGSGVQAAWHERASILASEKAEVVASTASSTSSWARRVRERRRDQSVLKEVRAQFPRSPELYVAWLQAGKFASIERQVVRYRGGFLPIPDGLWDGLSAAQPFARAQEGVIGSPVAARALDWRFRLHRAHATPLQWLRLDSAAFERLDAHVFCNGVPLGRITAGDDQSRVIGLRNIGSMAEVSVRPIWSVCELCYCGLDDMTVTPQSQAVEPP